MQQGPRIAQDRFLGGGEASRYPRRADDAGRRGRGREEQELQGRRWRFQRFTLHESGATSHPLPPHAILDALTEIRVQTSEDRGTGAPARATLRSVRVIVRGLRLSAPLSWLSEPTPAEVRCLALAALGTRHAGLARTRGRGHIRVALDGDVAATRAVARG